jgi:hypothetical protein
MHLMKRSLTLLLALSLLFSLAVPAKAVEYQVSGEMEQIFVWGNRAFDPFQFSSKATSPFYAAQRLRLQAEMIASENLKGVIQLQAPPGVDASIYWGHRPSGGGLGTTSAGPVIRHAYVQWDIPRTPLEIRLGLQPITLPFATFGNPVFDDQMAAVRVSATLSDTIAMNAFWARLFHDWNGNQPGHNAADAFGLTADFSFDQFRVTPWLLYTRIGGNSGFENDSIVGLLDGFDPNETAQVYVAGAALEILPLDALSIRSDLMLGSTSKSRSGFKTSGFLFTLAVDYEMPWGKPGVLGWYASGGKDTGKSFKALPVVATWGSFYPTRMGFPGSMSVAGADSLLSVTGQSTAGFGLQIADMSFVEDLSHTVRLAYIRGTSKPDYSGLPRRYGHEDGYGWMGTKDRALEIDLDTSYQFYENLAAYLEMGMIIPNFKEREDKTGVNAQITFVYSF